MNLLQKIRFVTSRNQPISRSGDNVAETLFSPIFSIFCTGSQPAVGRRPSHASPTGANAHPSAILVCIFHEYSARQDAAGVAKDDDDAPGTAKHAVRQRASAKGGGGRPRPCPSLPRVVAKPPPKPASGCSGMRRPVSRRDPAIRVSRLRPPQNARLTANGRRARHRSGPQPGLSEQRQNRPPPQPVQPSESVYSQSKISLTPYGERSISSGRQ